jgi:hypothetical protein
MYICVSAVGRVICGHGSLKRSSAGYVLYMRPYRTFPLRITLDRHLSQRMDEIMPDDGRSRSESSGLDRGGRDQRVSLQGYRMQNRYQVG